MGNLTNQWVILGRVAIAMVLGAIIGFEREVKDKPAGLRTHMLVAGSAALLVGLGDTVIQHFSQGFGQGIVGADPTRIIQAVITGISFLGAGTIIRREQRIEGLTTAASMLFTASVGIAVALQQMLLAVGLSALVLIVLRGLAFVDRWLAKQDTADDDMTAKN